MSDRDPFRSSVMARASTQRLLFILPLLGVLWLAILWAVSLP